MLWNLQQFVLKKKFLFFTLRFFTVPVPTSSFNTACLELTSSLKECQVFTFHSRNKTLPGPPEYFCFPSNENYRVLYWNQDPTGLGGRAWFECWPCQGLAIWPWEVTSLDLGFPSLHLEQTSVGLDYPYGSLPWCSSVLWDLSKVRPLLITLKWMDM